MAALVTNSGQWTSVEVTPIICELRQLRIWMCPLSLSSVLAILEQARYSDIPDDIAKIEEDCITGIRLYV